MEILKGLRAANLEQLVFWRDPAVNLEAVIAIKSTQLGPAVAGIRMLDYADEQAMLTDAADLAHEMTLRAALAGCDLGGGGIVVASGPTGPVDREAYFRSLGRHIERLGGRLYGVMEVGTDTRDLRNVKRETDYVLALSVAHGGLADASETTADGVVAGIRAVVKHAFGASKLENLTVLVQGLGRLGLAVLKRLGEAKARVIVTDRNYDKIKNAQDAGANVTMVQPGDVLSTKCDILVPCALGNIVTGSNVSTARCRAIAGGASNVIPDVETADLLHKVGVLYVPHFVIDAGELIQADAERNGWSLELMRAQVDEIYGRTLDVLEASRDAKEAPTRTAVALAEQRISTMSRLGYRGRS